MRKKEERKREPVVFAALMMMCITNERRLKCQWRRNVTHSVSWPTSKGEYSTLKTRANLLRKYLGTGMLGGE